MAPAGRFEAGSFQSFTLTYTAGTFGIDDTGSLKIVHRFASDMGRPQFDDPAAPNYITVEATIRQSGLPGALVADSPGKEPARQARSRAST